MGGWGWKESERARQQQTKQPYLTKKDAPSQVPWKITPSSPKFKNIFFLKIFFHWVGKEFGSCILTEGAYNKNVSFAFVKIKKKGVASRMILGGFLGSFGVGTCKKERTQSGGDSLPIPPPPFFLFPIFINKNSPREAIQIYMYIYL